MLEQLKMILLPQWDIALGSRGMRHAGKRPPKVARLVMIERSLCRHTSLKRIEGAKPWRERQSVRLKATATAPFHNSDFALLWGANVVSVFFWGQP